MLEELQHIYNQVKDENEISILKKYGNYAKLYTAIFMRKINMFALLLVDVNYISYFFKTYSNSS